jgi:HSP20 family protein
MENEVHRFLQSFFKTATEPYGDSCWRPSADVYRGRQGWLVKFDLAGVSAEEIQLRAEGRRLSVSGVRRDLTILDHQQAYSMEISYNRFERSVELPCDLTQADIHHECRDGMLLVLITPRSEPS